MRTLRLLVVAGLLAAAPAAAQSWYPSFGVSAGLTRFQLTGTHSAPFDQFDAPGASLLGLLPTSSGLFALIPVGDRLALEPSLKLEQATFTGSSTGVPASTAGLGLRGDYALTHHFYVALGAQAAYIEGSPTASFKGTSLGLGLAAGYRFALTGRLDGRVEAQATTFKKSNNIPAYNVYQLQFGLSTRLDAPRVSARPAARAQAPAGMWQPEIGVVGGYSHSHITGVGSLATFSLPGMGSGGAIGAVLAPSPPSLFVLLPLGDRWAFEVGSDLHQLRADGTTLTTLQLAPRIDLAVGPHWYAALGPQVHFLRVEPGISKTMGIAGVAAAWGARFHVAGALGGRVELGYGSNKARRGVSSTSAVNTFSLSVGAMMPLK